jgi:ankyrin repeat protein
MEHLHLLLDHGADSAVTDHYGRTPLLHSVDFSNWPTSLTRLGE